MTALKKIMNDEIKKYQGRIYYLDIKKDIYGNFKKPSIESAYWIQNTNCYDHCSFELHHMIKFTQFEQNKKWFHEQKLNNCLILIPKILHQHLENPVYELTNEQFYKKYLIQKYELLFNKTDYFNDKYPLVLKNTNSHELEFDGCFDCLEGVI